MIFVKFGALDSARTIQFDPNLVMWIGFGIPDFGPVPLAATETATVDGGEIHHQKDGIETRENSWDKHGINMG